jgi:LAO/AO transport system kinase
VESTPLAAAVRRGEPRALARAITLVENETAEGRTLIGELYAESGRARVIGVTGPPGAGKSTLVDQLIRHARERRHAVGVLAVDPTSAFTGGAILGDRVRMVSHAADDGVFIRSMATRGQLGGLARAVDDAAIVLAASGKDIILVETVGVGQDEIDVAQAADVSIVVLVPGTGDDVQAIKAGIMEIGDVFVVNKADRDGADRMVQSIEMNLSLNTYRDGEWRPPVVKTVATTGDGIEALWQAIDSCVAAPSQSQARRFRRQQARLRQLVADACVQRLERALPPGEFDRAVERVASRQIDAYSAVEGMLRTAFGGTASDDATRRPAATGER